MNNKQIHFIIQSKGGVGKSFFTYLLALKYEKDETVLFIDADNSTNTSTNQLAFLKGKGSLGELNLLDARTKKIVRDKIIKYLEHIIRFKHSKIIIDFGAPESEQLPALLSEDLTGDSFKEFEQALGVEFHFHIIIAGGGAFRSSVEYAVKMNDLLNNQFSLTYWGNIHTFLGYEDLVDTLKGNAEATNTTVKFFGNFESGSDLGKSIQVGIRQGFSLNEYSFYPKIKLKNEFTNIDSI